MYEYLRRPASGTPVTNSIPSRRAAPRTDAWALASSAQPETPMHMNGPSEGRSDAASKESTPIAAPGAGESLPGSVRRQMEPRFDRTFDDVRIHTGDGASRMARSFGARALTVGSEIVFGDGEYRPSTLEGRGLIAHELTHVVQNRAGASAGASLGVEPRGSHAEREANRAGARAGLGLPAGPIGASNAGVALTPTSDKIIPLISYDWNDGVVTAAEEKKVLALLSADPDLSATVIDLHKADMLFALLDRVDETDTRRDMLRLLGARLNAKARALVEPLVQPLDVHTGRPEAAPLQYNLGRLGVTSSAAPFDKSRYGDLIKDDRTAPFTGVGATGVNPSDGGYLAWATQGRKMFDRDINPLGNLDAYLADLGPQNRKRQVELLLKQPISSVFADSYGDKLPSRLQVIRSAANAHQLEPELVTAIILAEQRDQSASEDARDFILGLKRQNTSIGLGQVVISTAKNHDLFSDLLTNYNTSSARKDLQPEQIAWLLSSDEFNIFAVAKYIRIRASQGASSNIASLPQTKTLFPGLNLGVYAGHSSTWPEDNIGALGMYYTSRGWTDDVRSYGWGTFVLKCYKDVKSAKVF